MAKSGETTIGHYKPILQECWQSSPWFRGLLITSLVWLALRLAMQAYLLADPVSMQVGVDLQVYLEAAGNFLRSADLYPESLAVLESHFPYPPVFALAFIPFTWLPFQAVVVIHTLLHIFFTYLLFIHWGRIFQRWMLDQAGRMLALSLPLWIVFSAFWDDLLYLNIYTLMALLGTLLIESLLEQDLPRAVTWLTLILSTKPHWAFAVLLPLFFGQRRFFAKVILSSLVGYAALALLAILGGGADYAWGQYRDYFDLLARLGREFPWREAGAGFLGYNHSIKQVFAYFIGNDAQAMSAATGMKFLLLLPAAFIVIRAILRPSRQADGEVPALLELAFLLYLAAFIWLDILWEATLAIAIFTWALATGKKRWEGWLVAAAFIPYAILDIWRLVAYLAGAPLVQDAYLAWDYSMYIPTTLIVLLSLYIILLARRLPAGETTRPGKVT